MARKKKTTKELTLEKVEKYVEEIVKNSNDNDYAHVQEDNLYIRFTKHIERTGNKKQKAMAKAILKTKKIDFERFYM